MRGQSGAPLEQPREMVRAHVHQAAELREAKLPVQIVLDVLRHPSEPALGQPSGRPIGNRNHYQNVLGLFPKGWRVPLVYRRDNKYEILVRLMGTQRAEIDDEGKPKPPQPGPQPLRPQPPVPSSPATKLYQAKPGFANFYFNQQETNRLWSAFSKHGDFTALAGTWTIDADLEMNQKHANSRIVISDEKDAGGKITKTLSKLFIGNIGFVLDPLKGDQDPEDLKQPRDSGGLVMALYQYRRLLTLGSKGFEQGFSHGGKEPLYPMPADGAKPKSYSDVRVDAEVLRTEHAASAAKWFFSQKDQTLLGAEITVIRDEDPCELYFSDYKSVNGRQLPHRIDVRYGNGRFGVFTIKSYQLAAR